MPRTGLLPIAPPGTLPAPLRDRPAVQLDLTDVGPMEQVHPLVQAAQTLPPDQCLRVRIRALNWAAAAALQARNFHFQIVPSDRPEERILVIWHRYLPGMRREILEHLPRPHLYRVRIASPPRPKALADPATPTG